MQNNINTQALEEEVKQAAAMKNEVMEERRRLEEERRRLEEQVITIHIIFFNSLFLVLKDCM